MSSDSRLPAQNKAEAAVLYKKVEADLNLLEATIMTLTATDTRTQTASQCITKALSLFSWKIIYRSTICWQTWWKQIVWHTHLSINRPIKRTCFPWTDTDEPLLKVAVVKTDKNSCPWAATNFQWIRWFYFGVIIWAIKCQKIVSMSFTISKTSWWSLVKSTAQKSKDSQKRTKAANPHIWGDRLSNSVFLLLKMTFYLFSAHWLAN